MLLGQLGLFLCPEFPVLLLCCANFLHQIFQVLIRSVQAVLQLGHGLVDRLHRLVDSVDLRYRFFVIGIVLFFLGIHFLHDSGNFFQRLCDICMDTLHIRPDFIYLRMGRFFQIGHFSGHPGRIFFQPVLNRFYLQQTFLALRKLCVDLVKLFLIVGNILV